MAKISKSKNLAAGVTKTTKKAPNKKGDFITVQNRTLGNMEYGGTMKAKDGKWIQKAINPKHKGYCTPTTKATCTPKRKALAMTLKKMAKKK
jgi:hypothetical protein